MKWSFSNVALNFSELKHLYNDLPFDINVPCISQKTLNNFWSVVPNVRQAWVEDAQVFGYLCLNRRDEILPYLLSGQGLHRCPGEKRLSLRIFHSVSSQISPSCEKFTVILSSMSRNLWLLEKKRKGNKATSSYCSRSDQVNLWSEVTISFCSKSDQVNLW